MESILDFKLSPCSECCLFSFGWFPSVWFIYAYINQTSGNHPKENKQRMESNSLFI